MILHEYAILPFYIGQELSEHAQEQVKLRGWSHSDTPGTAEYLAYRLPVPINIPGGAEYHVDLAFIDTSACFLLHKIESQSTQSEYEMAKNILIERNHLNNHLLSNGGNPFWVEVLENLGVMDWRQTKAVYVFNFCVLEMDRIPTKDTGNALKIIADRSVVGINNKMTAREIKQLDFKSMKPTRLQELNDIDPNPHTTIYATWSSVVATTWGHKENVNATKGMLVEMELGLQSVWNHSSQLNISARAFPYDKGADFDQGDLLSTATRFLQTYKRRTSPSSTSSTREVHVLNQLVATSRLDKQIGELESYLLKEHNYRRELGQDWITIGLVLLAAIGVPQAIINLSMLEGWALRCWMAAALVASLVVGGCFSYRLTVKRTKQRHRK